MKNKRFKCRKQDVATARLTLKYITFEEYNNKT